jgi:prepilin-type N-terminal cleavage/methylation domain-containing protein
MTFKKIISKGFTLIELAVALTIVALVIGGLAVPLSKRIAEQQYIDTQTNIDKAIEALVGYAIQNRRLPCPDVNTAASPAPDTRDGFEDIAGAVGSVTGCSIGITGTASNAVNYHSDPEGVSWGDLPWQTLGLAPPYNVDAWNNRLRYAVFTPLVTQSLPTTPAFCNNTGTNAGIGFANLNCQTNPSAAGPAITAGVLNAQIDMRCANPATPPTTPALGCTTTSTVTPPSYAVSQNVVFVVYSMGANGLGATSLVDPGTATKFAFTPATIAKYPDQAANAPETESDTTQALASIKRRQFVVRARTDESSTSGAFDDVFGYMSAATLAAKLSSAGVWP